MKLSPCLLLALLPVCSLAADLAPAASEPKLIVHEWGTFTSLQDEAGEAIGGINTDDEPVPPFVHRVAHGLLLSPTEAPPRFFQGAPSCHPDVTMRLETPVLYFHPPTGWKPQPIDVRVAFQGGCLTEFFPDAIFQVPGLFLGKAEAVFTNEHGEQTYGVFGHIPKDAAGELRWKNVTLGGAGAFPETTEAVWLAPRAVDAAAVNSAAGEAEKFLFYRGVGHVDASLKITRHDGKDLLLIHDAPRQLGMLHAAEHLRIPAAWLVDVQADGRCAFRALGRLEFGADPRARVSASFAASEFSPVNLPHLKAEMHAALVAEGLFADEADALLKTWQASYFQSPGLRFFYLCPRADIDAVLPLEISPPAEITRVMIGRIELITPTQRALLKKIAAGPAPDLQVMRGVTADSQSDFFQHPENLQHWNDVMAGKAPYSALGLPIPPLYADYLKLGRFRNALILEEQKHRPTPELAKFIEQNGFEAFKID